MLHNINVKMSVTVSPNYYACLYTFFVLTTCGYSNTCEGVKKKGSSEGYIRR